MTIEQELAEAEDYISEILLRAKSKLDQIDIKDKDYSKNKLLVEEFRTHINEQIDLVQIC